MAEQAKERRGTYRLGHALQEYLRESGLAARMHDGRVFQAWSEALGESMARRAVAVRFSRGELLVEVQSAAHMHELQNFTGERYRALANRTLGTDPIRRVVFKLKR